MSLIFMDGFDHYGLDETNMTDGLYASVDGFGEGWRLETSNPRTGTHHLHRGVFTTPHLVRRALGGAKTTVGQGLVLYMSQLPVANDRYAIYDFRDAANGIQITIGVQSTGTIVVKRGNMPAGTVLFTTPTPALVATAYQHVETLVTFDNVAGAVEVRVDGVTVVSLSGVDTVNTANSECSQVALSCNTNAGGGATTDVLSDVDDYFVYDDTGSFNNTFIGDSRVLTLFPNADTAQEDWVPSTGADSFAMVDEADPNDDTDYISAAPGLSPTQVTEFELDDLPGGTSSVSAIQMIHRSRKTDSDAANVQLSAVSAASETAGADRPITEVYTYYADVIEADPDTAAPFTPSALNALKLKIARTA